MERPCAKLSAAPSRRLRRDLLGIDAAMILVGGEHHDQIGRGRRLGCRHDVKAVGSAPLAARANPAGSATVTATPLSLRFSAWARP